MLTCASINGRRLGDLNRQPKLVAQHQIRRLEKVGAAILGEEDHAFRRDHKGAGVNAGGTQTLLRRADVVVVRFGDKYRQWNAAFEAGYAAALGKPLITVHDADLGHALKEVDRAA